MSGQMAALFLNGLLVFSLQALGFLLTRLSISGEVAGGVMLMVFVLNPDVASCTGFCSVPGPLQSVQRAEMWGVILALQTSRAVHLGVDNLGVVRHVGRLLDGRHGPVPFELVKDGDLLLLIERMLHLRGPDTVRISKVKGHADEGMVLDGRVRDLDRIGNNACRGFSSVPGPLQTVQRAEMWGVVLALQSSRAVHLGVDNLGVVRHVDRLLRGCRGPKPFELVNDGDLLLLLEHMLNRRGLDTVRVSEVKGHADDAMVLHGQVRQDDRLGNDAAD